MNVGSAADGAAGGTGEDCGEAERRRLRAATGEDCGEAGRFVIG